jgi:UDP-N-acetylglucosamine diphosphorylase/glucosamine-1-phosphate N-acetyltransferase
MNRQLVLFEDNKFRNFLPLTWTRPVFDLRCGSDSLGSRIQRAYPGAGFFLACRQFLAGPLSEKQTGASVNRLVPGQTLFVNGRLLAPPDLEERIPMDGEDRVYLSGESVVAVRMHGNRLEKLVPRLGQVLRREDFPVEREEKVELPLMEYPWDLIASNPDALLEDWEFYGNKKEKLYSAEEGVRLIEPDRISIGRDAVIHTGAVLDATSGPVLIGEGAEILHQAVIQGPCVIGKKALIKVGANIYGGTSVGPWSKVGGEVDASIIQGFSNKQHDGFLGHSLIGSWVNLGAGTCNSDLKNNYGPVRVFIDGDWVDSGRMFFGLLMGDHSKTAIGTLFNTGTVVGVGCNVFGQGFPPKFIPSFSWGGPQGWEVYRWDRFLETETRVMARRQQTLSESGREMLRHIYRETADERKKGGGES